MFIAWCVYLASCHLLLQVHDGTKRNPPYKCVHKFFLRSGQITPATRAVHLSPLLSQQHWSHLSHPTSIFILYSFSLLLFLLSLFKSSHSSLFPHASLLFSILHQVFPIPSLWIFPTCLSFKLYFLTPVISFISSLPLFFSQSTVFSSPTFRITFTLIYLSPFFKSEPVPLLSPAVPLLLHTPSCLLSIFFVSSFLKIKVLSGPAQLSFFHYHNLVCLRSSSTTLGFHVIYATW